MKPPLNITTSKRKTRVGEGGREILSIETNGFRGSFRTIFTKTLQIKLFDKTIMVHSI